MAQRYIRPHLTLFVLIPSQGSIGERGLPLLPSDKHWPPLVDLILVRWSENVSRICASRDRASELHRCDRGRRVHAIGVAISLSRTSFRHLTRRSSAAALRARLRNG